MKRCATSCRGSGSSAHSSSLGRTRRRPTSPRTSWRSRSEPDAATRRLDAVRVLLDVSAVPARPVGAGMYTVALASGLDAHDGVELHLLTRHDDVDRWNDLAPNASVHGSAPARRPVRLAWEQARGPALAER